ncbi:conjugative transposon protein TraN [Empedobacter stercoris]|uniref:conjugative transposon protein TraN n=1 Tax=Empedobacter stercoris TaxID=1628248 RepID=UPI0021AF36A5|nr:conjugative transposon protein TraN [Empedobacter stercoris]UWX66188.1 conjugative transposon protein TraN [Empedobacter stercoris]
MKPNIFLFILSAFFFIKVNAQTATKEQLVEDLKIIEVSKGINLHIISPEVVQYVDLSTDKLTGDIPTENIARVKITDNDSIAFTNNQEIGIITVVGQSFIAQYRIVYSDDSQKNKTNIHIQAENMQPIEFSSMVFSNTELKKYSMDLITEKSDKKPIRIENNSKLTMQLNNVYVRSDYIFLDVTFLNSTNISYSIDDIKFTIEDKKIHKATNNQSIDLQPVFTLNNSKSFRKNFRNIYVFKKFTYPNSKVMMIRLIEEQLSGRTIEMKVNYSDILKADTF